MTLNDIRSLASNALRTIDDRCIAFRFKRPSGKDHEILVPRKDFEEDFEHACRVLHENLQHWMQWCDQQQVCPIKR